MLCLETLSLTVWAWRPDKAKGHLLSYRINDCIKMLFLEQPLALPGSANYYTSLGSCTTISVTIIIGIGIIKTAITKKQRHFKAVI